MFGKKKRAQFLEKQVLDAGQQFELKDVSGHTLIRFLSEGTGYSAGDELIVESVKDEANDKAVQGPGPHEAGDNWEISLTKIDIAFLMLFFRDCGFGLSAHEELLVITNLKLNWYVYFPLLGMGFHSCLGFGFGNLH